MAVASRVAKEQMLALTDDLTALAGRTVDKATRETAERVEVNRANHTRMPSGYGSWHDRAKELARTHVQRRCAGCGLWAIWEPKTPPAPVARPHACPSCRCDPEARP